MVKPHRLRRPGLAAAVVAMHGVVVQLLLTPWQTAHEDRKQTPPLALTVFPSAMVEITGEEEMRSWAAPPPALLDVATPFENNAITVDIEHDDAAIATLRDLTLCALPGPRWEEKRQRCESLRAQMPPSPVRVVADRDEALTKQFDREVAAIREFKPMPCFVPKGAGVTARCSAPVWRDP